MHKTHYLFMMSFVLLLALTIFVLHRTESKKNDKTLDSLTFVSLVATKPISITKPSFLEAKRKYNPNDLTPEQWQELGFSTKQVQTILSYKEKICKGTFQNEEQLAACYMIGEQKAKELSPYFLFPQSQYNYYTQSKTEQKKKLHITSKFNPDNYQQSDWEKIGFNSGQAQSIVKYRYSLPQAHFTKENLAKCYVISPEEWQQLQGFLLFSDKIDNNTKGEKQIISNYFDPNDLEKEDWEKLGFSSKQASTILNYKQKVLHGNFHSLQDIEKCVVISPEKFRQLQPWMQIENQQTQNPTPPIWEKPSEQTKETSVKKDINKVSFSELTACGFSEKAASSYLGFRRILGGFYCLEQVKETYNIDKIVVDKFLENAFVQKKSHQNFDLSSPNVAWEQLGKHPYFRTYISQIKDLQSKGFSSEEIIENLPTSKEQKEKMRAYLK